MDDVSAIFNRELGEVLLEQPSDMDTEEEPVENEPCTEWNDIWEANPWLWNFILFASRYPTSPSVGSSLYDCLNEGVAN